MPNILIVGATGQQGGGVVDALLATKTHNDEIYALSRNKSSPAARALTARGVHIVEGDLEDKASLERALYGCNSAYLVTDFRGSRDVRGEIEQGRNFVDAARTTGKKGKCEFCDLI